MDAHPGLWRCAANQASEYWDNRDNTNWAGTGSNTGLEAGCATHAQTGYCAGWGCNTDTSQHAKCECKVVFTA